MYQDLDLIKLKNILKEKETQTSENRSKIATLRHSINSGKHPLLDSNLHSVEFELETLRLARSLLKNEEALHGKMKFLTLEKTKDHDAATISPIEK